MPQIQLKSGGKQLSYSNLHVLRTAHAWNMILCVTAQDATERANIMSWLMFQMGGIGPMQGQANHFVAFAPVKLDYPIKRYVEETYRLYGVLEIGLQNADYLANNKYSIADIASFSWVVAGFFAG
ncbi:hypothetical protein MMC29_006983, partial [Sticta canariensis]|nr:hypothetical protein [Sticta canariensis]